MGESGTIRPPRTMVELYACLPEGTLAQLIENNIVLSPTPFDRHQKLLGEIMFELYQYVKQHKIGEIRVASYDVYLDRKNIFQPDICYISTQNVSLIKENGLHGAPDLVVEILSPGTARYDMYEKKDMY